MAAHAAEAEHRSGWEGCGAPATEAQLRAAHFGAPPAPPGGADQAEEVTLRRGHMRTQLGPGPGGAGSGPGRGVGSGVILPMRVATRVEAADVSSLGPLVDPEERTEHVGYLRDRRGAPVAEVWEKRPLLADGDYRRGPATSDHQMARLMGYDAHAAAEVHKAKVPGVMNPAEPRLGAGADASPAAARTVQVVQRVARAVHFNQQHAQSFASRDAGRELYDGYNDRRHALEKVPVAPPTMRELEARERAAARG